MIKNYIKTFLLNEASKAAVVEEKLARLLDEHVEKDSQWYTACSPSRESMCIQTTSRKAFPPSSYLQPCKIITKRIKTI